MAKKLTRIQKLMDERPEMFDFGDIPADRVKIPAQEAAYEKAAKAHRKKIFEYIAANVKATR